MCLQAPRHLIRTGYHFSDMLKVVPPAVKCLICWEHENDLTELKVLVNSLYVLLTNNYLKRNFSTCAAVYKLVPLIGVHLQGENNCEGVDTKINNFFGLFMSLLNLRSWTVTGNKMRGGGWHAAMGHRLHSIQTLYTDRTLYQLSYWDNFKRNYQIMHNLHGY